jgi:hypothetical protein
VHSAFSLVLVPLEYSSQLERALGPHRRDSSTVLLLLGHVVVAELLHLGGAPLGGLAGLLLREGLLPCRLPGRFRPQYFLTRTGVT